MPTPTKFAPPRLSTRSVVREQLIRQLQRSRECSLMLVTGPAGFGKTTLLAQWRRDLMKQGARVAWLSLASEDSAFAEFAIGLVSALQQIGIALEELALFAFDAGAAASVEAVAATLIGAAARMPAEIVVVIDDFHHVEDAHSIAVLQTLVEHGPENMHFVVASRTRPAMPVARWRASGRLVEIEVGDLAFDFDETVAFLRSTVDDAFDLDGAQLIHELTDGWPIGMQLVSIALKADPKARARLRSLVARTANLRAYLDEDVVAHLPPPLVAFLERISILRRFNASLSADVAEEPDAPALIANLEQRNLFVFAVDADDRTPWYRLHPLFAEFLAERLQRRPDEAAKRHLRASRWLAEQGMLSEAIRHAATSGDRARAIELVESAAPPVRDFSNLGTFMRWVEDMPLALMTGRPKLLLLGAWTYALTFRTEKTEQWLAQLDGSGGAAEPGTAVQLKLIHAMLAILREDPEGALALLAAAGTAPREDEFLDHMHTALSIIGLSQLGRHEDAHGCFHAFEARHRGDGGMALLPATTAAAAALHEGKVTTAERLAADTLARIEGRSGRRVGSATGCGVVLASALYEQDRIDEARSVLANRLDFGQYLTPHIIAAAVDAYARLLALQESPREAQAFLARQAALFRARGNHGCLAWTLATQATLALADGDGRQAARWQLDLQTLAAQRRPSRGLQEEIAPLAALVQARLALADRKAEAALAALETVQRHAAAAGRGRMLVTADLLSAIAQRALGRDGPAAASLAAALASGYRLGLVRTFVDEGPALADALAHALAHALAGPDLPLAAPVADHARRIAAAFDAAATGPTASAPTSTAPAAASRALHLPAALGLTQRERDVLLLLEQSMSNKHIAAALNLTLGTTKWYMKNILAKLGVASRYEAIVYVRKLRAVDPS